MRLGHSIRSNSGHSIRNLVVTYAVVVVRHH